MVEISVSSETGGRWKRAVARIEAPTSSETATPRTTAPRQRADPRDPARVAALRVVATYRTAAISQERCDELLATGQVPGARYLFGLGVPPCARITSSTALLFDFMSGWSL